MLNYSVLIVDDDPSNIELLKIYIKKYCKTIDTIYDQTTLEGAIECYAEHYPDILILDIDLGNGITSFNLFDALPNLSAQIVFTTSHSGYAIEAINKAKPAAYLIKPIRPIDLVHAIDKVTTIINEKNATLSLEGNKDNKYLNFIAIPSTNKIDIIHIDDIVYLQANGRYTTFFLLDGTQKIASRNLGEYEKQLDPKLFFRIHHSYVVNLSMVININKSAGNYCELSTKQSLPIAKRRQEQLHRFLKIK